MNEICCDGKIEKGRKIKATTSSFSLFLWRGEEKPPPRQSVKDIMDEGAGWLLVRRAVEESRVASPKERSFPRIRDIKNIKREIAQLSLCLIQK